MSDAQPDQETIQLLQELHRELLNNPTARTRIKAALARDQHKDISRAILWSKNSSIPYYKEHFAREIQPFLDQMIESRKPLEWQFASFPNLAKRSIHHKVYQSFLWLVDNDDAKYEKLRQETEIRETRTGIRIQFIGVPTPGNFAPTEVEHGVDENMPQKPALKWRTRLNEFIEFGEVGTVLELTRLNLSEADITEINESVLGLRNIRVRADHKSLKAVKLTEEQMKEFGIV